MKLRCFDKHHFDRNQFDILIRKLTHIEKELSDIMATQDELAAKLSAIGDELDKATAEIVAAIQALKDALAAAGSTTPAVDAAVTRLETGAKALDDLNPDVVVPPTP